MGAQQRNARDVADFLEGDYRIQTLSRQQIGRILYGKRCTKAIADTINPTNMASALRKLGLNVIPAPDKIAEYYGSSEVPADGIGETMLPNRHAPATHIRYYPGEKDAYWHAYVNRNWQRSVKGMCTTSRNVDASQVVDPAARAVALFIKQMPELLAIESGH